MGCRFPVDFLSGRVQIGTWTKEKWDVLQMQWFRQPTYSGILWIEVEESRKRRSDFFSASLDMKTLLKASVSLICLRNQFIEL